MNLINVLGMLAGGLTTASFVPQAIKTFRNRSTKDISLGMYLVLWAGVALWIVYGLLAGALPVILANSCTIVLVTVLIALKIRYK